MNATIQKKMGEDPSGGPLLTSSSTSYQYLGCTSSLRHDEDVVK